MYYSNHILDLYDVYGHYVSDSGSDLTNPESRNSWNLQTIYIVTDYAHNNLRTILDDLNQRNKRLSWFEIAKILHEVLCGLKYLHSSGLVHRNLKPANICVNTDIHGGKYLWTKIVDFSSARKIVQNDNGVPYMNMSVYHDNLDEERLLEALTSLVQAVEYRAPEIILETNNHHYNYSIDIWSLAVIMMELITCRPLLENLNILKTIGEIANIIGAFPNPTNPDLSLLAPQIRNLFSQFPEINESMTEGPSNIRNKLSEDYNAHKNDFKGNLETNEQSDQAFDLYTSLIRRIMTWSPNSSRPSADDILNDPFFLFAREQEDWNIEV